MRWMDSSKGKGCFLSWKPSLVVVAVTRKLNWGRERSKELLLTMFTEPERLEAEVAGVGTL